MVALEVMIKIALAVFVIFSIKKPSLLSSNSVCYCDIAEDIQDSKDYHLTASIWNYKQERGISLRPRSALMILFMLAGDIETCPGPCLKCNCCSKTIRKNQTAGCCSICENKLHIKCLLDMVDRQGKEKLYCPSCVPIEDESFNTNTTITCILETLNNFLRNKGLKIFHQNVNGLVMKIEQLRLMLQETNKNIQIFGITESHLHKNIQDSEVAINGYSFVRKDRVKGPGGGVGCYIREDIKWKRRSDLEKQSVEAIWIEIFFQNSKSILLCMIYRPPDSSKHLDANFESNFEEMNSLVAEERKETIVIGDLNCNYLNNADHKSIKRILQLYGLKQIIKQPTRITPRSRSLIDIICTTHESRIPQHIVIANSISDHDVIGITRKMNSLKFKSRKINIRSRANYNVNDLKADLREFPWETIIDENNVQSSWNSFKQILTTIINRHAPLIEKKVKGRDCPWLTHEIKEKMNERDYLLKKARKSGKECDWCNYRKARNSVTNCIRQHKANYNRSVFRENVNRPKQFWDQIKKCYPTRSKMEVPNKLFDDQGQHISDNCMIANTFCKFFTGIGTSIQQCYVTLTEKPWKFHSYLKFQDLINPSRCVFKFKELTAWDVLSIIKGLRPSTAVGYDNIPVSFIKDGAQELTTPLVILINLCLRQSIFPDAEKLANITPVFKSGDRSSMNNYRPISVLPVLAKIIERVVHRQLSNYLEDNSLLSTYQFGFRKGRSTHHAVTFFSDYIRNCMDNGEYCGAAFIDLNKAFDTVDHGRLLSKLPYYGIKDKELTWFEDYLFGRRQCVIYDGTRSESQPVVCGVPQGSILGPMLFILLINDIDHQLNSCKILLYADDAVVFISSKNQETIQENLNSDLSNLAAWFYENNLVVNLKKGKTEFILYGTSNKLSKAEKMDIMMRNEPVNEVETYRYLGVKMDKSLTYVEQKDKMYKEAMRRVKLLSRVRRDVSPLVAQSIYKTMIEPILLYCNNLFLGDSVSSIDKFQKVQDRAFKIVYGNNIQNNWTRLENIRNRLCVIDVFKCLNSLAPQCYDGYFQKFSHGKGTRGDNNKLFLPKVRTEAARKRFAFQGAVQYNKLPDSLTKETSLLRFKEKCKNYF